jgi:hypothetical protein
MKGFEMRKRSATQRQAHDRDGPAPAAAAGRSDDGPEDIDEFRMELARMMVNFMHGWRDCPEPACRRAHACRGRTLVCSAKAPKPSPQATARATADIVHLLKRVCARTQAEPAPQPAHRPKAKL